MNSLATSTLSALAFFAISHGASADEKKTIAFIEQHCEDALARNVARQFLIYATGTGIHFTDRPAIEAIIAKTKPSKHGIRSLVLEVVASELFQTK